MQCEHQGRMMDSGTSVPKRPMKIIFQQTGFRDKEIPGGGSSISKGPGTWVYSIVGHSQKLRPLDSDTESDSQVAESQIDGILECKNFSSLSKTEVHLVRSLPSEHEILPPVTNR